MTFKKWPLICPDGHQEQRLIWDYDIYYQVCDCGLPMELEVEVRGQSASVIGDDIPGGVEIRHLGPKPQRFYSKTEIRRAANEGGWTQNGDTPKPYKVSWSGRRRDGR